MRNIENLKYTIEDLEEAETPIEKVTAAQDILKTVISILQEVVDETGDRNAEAYVVDHLKIIASNDHGFLSRDLNLDKWIERLERAEDDDS